MKIKNKRFKCMPEKAAMDLPAYVWQLFSFLSVSLCMQLTISRLFSSKERNDD